MTGAEGLGSGASVHFAQLSPSGPSLRGVGGLSGGEGATGLSGGAGAAGLSSASISGPGQLVSALQQLQAQDPTKFTQVAAQIASQLQTAAQQTQGAQASFLSSLAQQLQSAANGGSLALPQAPPQNQPVPATYAPGSAQATQSVAGFAPTAGNSGLQQLFAGLANQVSQALAA